MSFKEVKALRQENRLDEALEMAKTDLANDPENIWNKRSLAWVYYALLKKSAGLDKKEALNILVKVNQLNMAKSEAMLFDSMAWQMGKTINALGDNDSELLRKILKVSSQFHYSVPGDGYTFMVKCMAKKGEARLKLHAYLDFWSLHKFQRKDYENSVSEEGKQFISVVEQVYIALAKNAMTSKEPEYIKEVLSRVQDLCKAYPGMAYMHYYHAKLLLALGDRNHFLKAFVPFARKKQRDFWVWELVADAFDKNSEAYYACLCKSLSCGAPAKFSLNVKEKLAECLIRADKLPEAKRELEDAIHVRQNNNWKLTKKLEEHQKSDWFANTVATKTNKALYTQHSKEALQVLHADKPAELIVVERVNRDKKVLNYISEKPESGFFAYGHLHVHPQVGDVLEVRFDEASRDAKSNFCKVFSASVSNQKADALLRPVSGTIKINPGNSFGFLDDAFVEPSLVKQHHLKDGQEAEGILIRSFNKKLKKWGWRVIQIIKK